MDQPNQLCQSQGLFPQSSSSNFTTETNGADDWQEEAFQKIKQMKESYYTQLSEMYQKIATKLQQHDSLPQQPKTEQLEKLKMFKTMLERLVTVLQFSKNSISPGLKEKLPLYEKHIISFINTNRPRKPVSFLDNPQKPEMQSVHVLQQPKVEQQESNGSMDVNINSSNPVQRPPQGGGAAPIDTADWKIHFMPELRQRNVNRIVEALKRHLPFSSPEEILELQRIATRVEGDIYAVAFNQLNYQWDVTLMLLNIDTHRPNQRAPWAAEADWRINLDSRQRIVNKILETLKLHLPYFGQEGLLELQRIATRFEEKIYASASSQSDYLRKISLKMLTMEARNQQVARDPPTNLKRRRVYASGSL